MLKTILEIIYLFYKNEFKTLAFMIDKLSQVITILS